MPLALEFARQAVHGLFGGGQQLLGCRHEAAVLFGGRVPQFGDHHTFLLGIRHSLDDGPRRRSDDAVSPIWKLVAMMALTALATGAPALLAELAELLEIPVSHTLMGKGCMPDGHPLLAGQTGFWGTPVSNALCRNADSASGGISSAKPGPTETR